jgi:beta-galactosidase beta subunit
MLRPFCNISIGDNDFDFVTTGEFSSSWKTLTDTGEITIPHKVRKNGLDIFIGEDNLFKKGDEVNISAGYYPTLELIFSGYVSRIEPSLPVSITFEDAAFLLKQTNLTLSFKKVTLKELLTASINEAIGKATGYVKAGLERITVEAIDADLGAFRITNVNITGILQELKKTYALTSYFRGHTLYVGLAYYAEGRDRATFTFQENIIDSGTQLEYKKIDDISFKVKAVSMLENNTKLEIEVGDPDGEQRTITKYNLSEKDLRAAAEREIGRLKYEGFRGKLFTFLQPVVRHGDEIEIIDPLIPERNGVYLAESVEYSIGVDGYFQSINLGAKISS